MEAVPVPLPVPVRRSAPPAAPTPLVLDCDGCAVRHVRCHDCVVSVLLGPPSDEPVGVQEQQALAALADAGLVPRLQLVPLPPVPPVQS